MSATFNVLRFAEYFSYPLDGNLVPAPIIDLDKSHDQKTSFMIHEYYLCQMGILKEVSSLHVCKLEWRSVSHCYMRQFYVTWESYWSHLVGGIAREELCVQMCFEVSYSMSPGFTVFTIIFQTRLVLPVFLLRLLPAISLFDNNGLES